MDIKKETYETWNQIADLYQSKFMNMDFYNESYDAFCDALKKPNAKVLELGCGPGNVSKYLLTKRPDISLLGIDIAPNMIKLAKQNNPTAHFEVLDVMRIGELKELYDGIIGGFCLPYVSTDESKILIETCFKLLTENGICYLSFVEGKESESGYKTGGNGLRTFFYYHSLEALKTLAIQSGFKSSETMKINYPTKDHQFDIHTVLLLKK